MLDSHYLNVASSPPSCIDYTTGKKSAKAAEKIPQAPVITASEPASRIPQGVLLLKDLSSN